MVGAQLHTMSPGRLSVNSISVSVLANRPAARA